MGYNATYGLQESDSMSEFFIGDEKDGQLKKVMEISNKQKTKKAVKK